MTDDYFRLKARTKEARDAMKLAPDFYHRNKQNKVVKRYLLDLAENLSEYHRYDQDEDAALAFVIRTMGLIARQCADEVYAPYGYKNPFKSIPKKPQEPVKPIWAFPVVNMPSDFSKGSFSGEFRDFSALTLFGYKVGKINGWPTHKRRVFLTQFMEMELPGEVQALFDDEYGSPLSVVRLRKVANLLANNASLRYRIDARMYAEAIADWEDDLSFLRQKYYEGAGLKFQPWPSTKN